MAKHTLKTLRCSHDKILKVCLAIFKEVKSTAWKVSKNWVFSGPYFPVFNPNTGKYGLEKTPYLGTVHPVMTTLNFLFNKASALHKKWSFPLRISSVNVTKFLRIWSNLLKKSLRENFIFCAVLVVFALP